jgi:hypothetical protein
MSLPRSWDGDILHFQRVEDEKSSRKTTPTQLRAFVHRLHGRTFGRTSNFASLSTSTAHYRPHLVASKLGERSELLH